MYFTPKEKEQISSIKCFYPLGGQSNFKFSYNENEIKNQESHYKKYPDTKLNYDILNLQNNGLNNHLNERNYSIKTNYEYGKENLNIYKNEYPVEKNQSSIKVTQKPGGYSCVHYAKEQ